MDDKTTPLTSEVPTDARTAEALRALQERTQAALAARRARMGEFEAQLTQQLDAIADQIAAQSGANGAPCEPSEHVERLRAELKEARAEWGAEREAWDAERQAWQAERDKLVAADRGRSDSLDQRQADLDARQQALDGRAAELNHRDRELRQRQELLDSFTAQSTDQQSQLAEREQKLARDREEFDTFATEIRAKEALLEHQQSELVEREQACQRDETALMAERATLNSDREAFLAQQSEAANAAQSTTDELVNQLAAAQSTLAVERASWEAEFAAVRADRRKLEVEQSELSAALDAAHADLKAARVDAGVVVERDELRQKFELALEDVQRLRGRVTELEQELASRPEADQSDSVELVQLRAERDALTQRVSELEKQSAASVVTDSSEEIADLQRRFELAVEDVRDLKKKNSQLEEALAEAKSRGGAPSGPVSGGGGNNWELMKKQMLANLEGEVEDGEYVEEEREKERATIEDTIRITDEVVANKDREIAELKARVVADGVQAATAHDDKFRDLVDADEVIRQHRERIAKLEREMEDKLRAAELELSVERAKIAREQTQLADLRAEIDSQRAQGHVGGNHGGAASAQAPKRRWLSKLGLTGEDQ